MPKNTPRISLRATVRDLDNLKAIVRSRRESGQIFLGKSDALREALTFYAQYLQAHQQQNSGAT